DVRVFLDRADVGRPAHQDRLFAVEGLALEGVGGGLGVEQSGGGEGEQTEGGGVVPTAGHRAGPPATGGGVKTWGQRWVSPLRLPPRFRRPRGLGGGRPPALPSKTQVAAKRGVSSCHPRSLA